jgi:hypothetical protein
MSSVAASDVKLITQIQICRRLGIAVNTWRNWRVARQAPAPVPNVPGRPRWRVADIEAFERGLFRHGGRTFFGAARRRA